MRVLVFLAGIADPKWPLAFRADPPFVMPDAARTILGPFDEAALEIGLAIRDGRRDVHLTVALAGGPGGEALARRIAAHRPDRIFRIDDTDLAPWDGRAFAARLARLVGEEAEPPDLVLIGREFGDHDVGVIAACLAAALGRPQFALVQAVRWDGDRLELVRERGVVEEIARVSTPMVASVTNDRRNRLRHSLMKNVIEAKRAAIPVAVPPAGDPSRLAVVSIAPPPPAPREVACRLLTGGRDDQVAELARFLATWRAGS